jgi:hypothetical protein
MTFNSCKQEPNLQTILENTETRNESMQTSADNPDVRIDFMKNMKSNSQALLMIHSMMKDGNDGYNDV